MIVHHLPGLCMQRLYQMVTYFLPLYHNYKIRETAILAVSCVGAGKAGEEGTSGDTESLQMSQGGHGDYTWGPGMAVAEDREVDQAGILPHLLALELWADR